MASAREQRLRREQELEERRAQATSGGSGGHEHVHGASTPSVAATAAASGAQAQAQAQSQSRGKVVSSAHTTSRRASATNSPSRSHSPPPHRSLISSTGGTGGTGGGHVYIQKREVSAQPQSLFPPPSPSSSSTAVRSSTHTARDARGSVSTRTSSLPTSAPTGTGKARAVDVGRDRDSRVLRMFQRPISGASSPSSSPARRSSSSISHPNHPGASVGSRYRLASLNRRRRSVSRVERG